ncbi:DEKNAAC100374 [Brettanomyces naardenensis]|uniref:DNA-binding protein RAP1 n=1 Tax=Brettanomyces naardenensis TaxID=13370 RepID=A0A448YFL1_BRENA|nr:DEKNAAC100374 [Brettanomyces naardenensis]
MITQNGGQIVTDLSHNCIVISSDEYTVPDDLLSAHIYSYKVIEDSVASGVQLEFSHYLIHRPAPPQELETMGGEGAPATSGVRDNDNDNELGNGNVADTNTMLTLAYGNASARQAVNPARHHGVKYFTPDEDAALLEEIRRRPWLGFKGHQIYKDIAELGFFKERGRTAASLRERIRTLKYNVGYVYDADKNHNLLRDENGNLVRSSLITPRIRPFSAIDDFGLCKVIYKKLNPQNNNKGFETVSFPTNFFDKYGALFPQHTPESWRQRYKNYLQIFGVTNYLKYFIIQRHQGKEPLPSNAANRDWIRARRLLHKTDGPRLYFPNIPEEDQFIDDNIDSIHETELEGKSLDVFTPIAYSESHSELPKSEEVSHSKRYHASTKVLSPPLSPLHQEHTDPTSITVFVDLPTTTFREKTFTKSYEKYGRPMDLESILPHKEEFYAQLHDVLSQDSISPKELSAQLDQLGIKEYYTVFLMHRCNSNRKLVEESIKRYVETNGTELLCIEPGAWSNKSLDWLDLRNDHLNDVLKKYHGEANFKSQVESLRRTRTIKW